MFTSNEANSIKMGLCQGRHEIPGISEYVFPNTISDVTDIESLETTAKESIFGLFEEKCPDGNHLDLYVTGLTVALVAVINICNKYDVELTLWHYNNATGEYYPQNVYRQYSKKNGMRNNFSYHLFFFFNKKKS